MNAILTAAMLVLAAVAPAGSEPAAPAETSKTLIRSEFADFDYKLGKGVFEGNVVVTDPQLKLKSNKMIVYLDQKAKYVTKVEAMGKVIIEQGDKTAYSDQATYNKETGLILLTPRPGGDQPRIEDKNGNVIRGDEIVVNRNDNSMKANGHVSTETIIDKKKGDMFSPTSSSPPAAAPKPSSPPP
ncbi:MAG: hypothetical protein JO317_05985 [Verrucomicrobiae bacterium]|nr:hypothetical protein [Verrucomicrobiae bacterium]